MEKVTRSIFRLSTLAISESSGGTTNCQQYDDCALDRQKWSGMGIRV